MTPQRVAGRLAALAAGLAALALLSWSPLPAGDDVVETEVVASATQRPDGPLSDDGPATESPDLLQHPPDPKPARSASSDQRPASDRASAPAPVAPPSVLRIGAVGIEAPVVSTDTDQNGELQVPPPQQVGWFERWPAPGDPGAAVIVGHVDSRTGPGALFTLEKVRPGMPIEIERQDGSTVSFLVDRIETHAKDRFPTQAVYGHVPEAQLRLITCTGPFDPATRQYRENLVVFATAISAN